MVCFSTAGFGVELPFRSLALHQNRPRVLWGNQCVNSEVLINTDRKVTLCHWLESVAPIGENILKLCELIH